MDPQKLQEAVDRMSGPRKDNAQRALRFASMCDDPAQKNAFLRLARKEIREYSWAWEEYNRAREWVAATVRVRKAVPAYMGG